MIGKNSIHPGSFRDPAGFLFFRQGILYRQINKCYQNHYELFQNSGLYKTLTSNNLLIPHEEVSLPAEQPDSAFRIIKPNQIPFISYPYEWCFSQLKQAALLTLEIQKISLDHGMILKDASVYNVQFFQGKPIFIDTLSFERYDLGRPWNAYRQFCRHFLAPLALMSMKDVRLGQLFRIFSDGIPLDLASSILPKRTWLNTGLLMHIHLHSRSERKYANVHVPIKLREISRKSLLGILDSLTITIDRMYWQPEGTEWADYYQNTNYSVQAFEHKKEVVKQYLEMIRPITVWDLGANNGIFSRIASEKGIATVAFDIDPACVELNYREIVQRKEQNHLTLLLDLTNPSPGIGWDNAERDALQKRGPADTAFALALIHHLAISNNIPFGRIAEFLSNICNSLIIEFVPKTDSQVQKLLLNRKDIFWQYDIQHFERSFSDFFKIECREKIKSSDRFLYLMIKK